VKKTIKEKHRLFELMQTGRNDCAIELHLQ